VTVYVDDKRQPTVWISVPFVGHVRIALTHQDALRIFTPYTQRNEDRQMTATIISSQRYIDDAVVAEKAADQDFEVALSPAFEYDGRVFQVVLDGHHSLAAAAAAGVKPEYAEATEQDNDAVALIRRGEIEDFLAVSWVDADYYYVETGSDIW